MADFKNYIERRQRVEAFRFTDPVQATFVAGTFRSDSFNLEVTGDSNGHVDIAVKDGPVTYTQRVNIGDWIVRKPWSYTLPQVIPNQDFNVAWEEDK